MEKYKRYMDSVEVSPELHEKLMGLGGRKKPAPWKKYGAMAAALALVIGVSALGLTRWGGNAELGDPEPVQCMSPVPVESSAAIGEIAVEDPNAPDTEGTKSIGGYEVPGGEVVSYLMLPYIAYGEKSGESAASLAPPAGVERRELTETEILNLFGCGEEALSVHLNWGGYELSGYVMAYEDGTVWRAAVFGTSEEGHFELIVCPDVLPQECCIVEGRAENVTNVWGVDVTGWYGGIYGEGENREVWLPESREVEFLANGVGCRFCFYGLEGEADMVVTMVSRFVRWAVVEGLELDALTPGWKPEPSEEPNYGDSGASPSQGPAGEVSTPGYDPTAEN